MSSSCVPVHYRPCNVSGDVHYVGCELSAGWTCCHSGSTSKTFQATGYRVSRFFRMKSECGENRDESRTASPALYDGGPATMRDIPFFGLSGDQLCGKAQHQDTGGDQH